MICLLNVVNLVLQINNLNREIATAANVYKPKIHKWLFHALYWFDMENNVDMQILGLYSKI